jgi:hypothetical protein
MQQQPVIDGFFKCFVIGCECSSGKRGRPPGCDVVKLGEKVQKNENHGKITTY